MSAARGGPDGAPVGTGNGHAPAPSWSANRSPGGGATAGGPGQGSGAEPMIGVSPFVSVPTLLAALRRRWRLWVSVACLGLVGGLAIAALMPPPYTATATVLLQHPSGIDDGRAMLTERQLLKTRTVAQGAIDQAHLSGTAKHLLTQYDGTILSDRILSVTAQATSAGEAARRGDAVTNSYLTFRRNQFQQQLAATVQVIQARENVLASELASLDDQINAFSAAPQRDPAAVRAFGDVLTHRAQVADQLATLQREVDADTSDTNTVISGSRVIDPAAADPHSMKKTIVLYALAGLVLAFMVGAGGVVVAEVISEGARRRGDVATALGAPVAVSVAIVPQSRARRRKGQPTGAAAATPGLAPITRHLRQVLQRSGGPRPALLVVSLRCDGPARLAVEALAAELSDAGSHVLVADFLPAAAARSPQTTATGTGSVRWLRPGPAGATADGGSESWLAWGADVTASQVGGGDLRSGATGGSRAVTDIEAGPVGDADVVVALAGLDPALGAFHLRPWAATAVAIVTAGRATPNALRSAGQMLPGAGIDLVSAVLVGADPRDETLGIPDGWAPGAAPASRNVPGNGAASPSESPAPAPGPGS